MKAVAQETRPRVRRLNRKQEAYAQAIAHGATWREATVEAGYSMNSSEASERVNHPAIVARVAELILEQQWGGSRDLAPVIDAMRRLFEDSHTMTSAAAIKERREILVQAARLKALLPLPEPSYVREPPLTSAEWLEKYAPKP